MPTYAPTEATLNARANLPDPKSLPPITVAELAAMNTADEEFNTTSVMGYCFKLKKGMIFFGNHKGRDISSRQVRHFNGISADDGPEG